jgi:cyclic beta-1,2-glucan synthetase
VVVLGEGLRTPAPWINVIANPSFGFLVSESGSGHTWSLNSHENQLTPWSNDPVSDPPGEAIYIRDDAHRRSMESHGPADPRRSGPYICRHGQGYSRFQHGSHGILHELTAIRARSRIPIKISRLTLNKRIRARGISP